MRSFFRNNRVLIAVLLMVTLTLGILVACNNDKDPAETTGDETTASIDTIDAVTTPTTTPDGDESDTETLLETEPATEPVTEPETETVYDIVKPSVMDPGNENFYNVKNYGAKGDGKTDDSKAIITCINEAFEKSGVVFFPEGEYLVSRTVKLPANDSKVLQILGDGATIVTTDEMDGPIFEVGMKYNFSVNNLDFVHNGKGSCIKALFLQAKWCRFTTDAENPANAVEFNGSNCRITECSFDVANPAVYALAYVKAGDQISINDFIIDSVFRGGSKGILVGDGVAMAYGRVEGLKINNNYFYNTGAEQVRVAEILHCHIANNTFRNGTGDAIVLTQAGHGPDGVYISNNDIVMGEGAHACIATVEGGDNYVSSVNINNNRLVGGEYGVNDLIIMTRAFVRENVFEGQSKAGYAIAEKNITAPYMLMDNVMDLPEGVLSVEFPWRVMPTFVRNVVGVSNTYPERMEAEFKAGCISLADKGNNVTVLPPFAGESSGNKYDGMEYDDSYDYSAETAPPAEDIEVPEGAVNKPLNNGAGAVGRTALHIDGSIAARFTAVEEFYGLTIVNPSWSDSIGSFFVTIYKWQGTYEDTITSAPVLGADWINFKDNNENRILTSTPLEAGEYLVMLKTEPGKGYQMVGCWTHYNEKPVQTEVYLNGELQPTLEIAESTIHYVKEPGT